MACAGEIPLPALSDFRAETFRGVSGFVRVGQTRAGQWWLLDPDDRPFFSRGVTGINRFHVSAPETDDEIDLPEFIAPVLQRLRAWHVDTLGAWAAPELYAGELYVTEMLEFRKLVPEAAIKLGGAMLPDVFDPRWIEACDRRAAEICVLRRDHRRLLGYFTDHELGWAQPRAETAFAQTKLEGDAAARVERPSLLQICLSLEPAFAAYHAAWEFVLAPHGGDLDALARDWDLSLPNKEVLRQLTLADTPLFSEGYLCDNERFSREFARNYFATSAAAIRRYDPHHLVLGCRFGGPPGPAVLRECAYPHVDVLSANDYHDTLFERLDEYAPLAGMPVLLGDFSWVSDYFTKRPITG